MVAQHLPGPPVNFLQPPSPFPVHTEPTLLGVWGQSRSGGVLACRAEAVKPDLRRETVGEASETAVVVGGLLETGQEEQRGSVSRVVKPRHTLLLAQ